MNPVETFEYVVALWTADGWGFFLAGAVLSALATWRMLRAKGE